MDLSTKYLGLELRSPLVASPSPLSSTVDGVKELEDAGAAAVVLYSLFEEQLTLSTEELMSFLSSGSSYAETLSETSESMRLHLTPIDYLRHVDRTRNAVGIPVIASINGSPHLRWTHYAKLLEQAGASAIELNLYFVPTDFDRPGADIEQAYLDTVHAVVREVEIPVAVKLSPYFSNLSNMAKRIVDAGADGLVLFNRFYQPDLDIDRREVMPHLDLSTSQALRLPLRWVSILYGRVEADLALTSGVHTWEDALKAVLAGANVAMLCSVLLKHGLEQIQTIEQGLRAWMAAEDINRFDEVRGTMSQARCTNPAAFERAQYIRTLETQSR